MAMVEKFLPDLLNKGALKKEKRGPDVVFVK